MAGAVFDDLVGQDEAVDTLCRAAAAAARIIAARAGDSTEPPPSTGAMTHAWIFTGPPGSGRSVAARAFAAALQCATGDGCGHCHGCHTTMAGTHADVRFVVPEGLSISVNEMRALVLRAASTPSGGRWQVVVIADADRLTEAAGNALLKAVEEPPPQTVFLLCTPSTHPDDISVTIRSRCRVVPLRQPPPEAVAEVLVRRDGVAPDTASWVAAAAQGHVGRARRLAIDEQARQRRVAVLAVPRQLTGVGADRGRRGRGRGGQHRLRRQRTRRPRTGPRRGRHRPRRGHGHPRRRRPDQGPGEAAEVPGHPGAA
jgi:DNA polymerase-3 subunit delta'